MKSTFIFIALNIIAISLFAQHAGNTTISGGSLTISNPNGIGNGFLNINGPIGQNLSINSYKPLQGKLTTRIGINFAIDGNGGIASYAIVGAKKTPFIELDAENGSIGLYGEHGSGSDWRFSHTSSTLGLLVDMNGNVGIGTPSPEQKLDIRGNLILQNGGDPVIYTGTGGSELYRYLTLFNSVNAASASGLKAGGILISDAYAYANPGKNDLVVKGKISIGTPTHDPGPNTKLTVKGSIHAEEVKVDLNVPGPDYVFDADYPLASLEDTKAYINQNKHLPGIPSSDEMQLNGVNLLEMNMKLLEKVEEVTLYLIQLKKENDLLKERIVKLENN